MAEAALAGADTGRSRRGLHRVEHIMGTAISVDVRDPDVTATVVDAVFERIREDDRRFSPWKPDSEISRIGRGELMESESSGEVRHVLALCDDLARTTGGAFDARGWRTDGSVDPSGLVKGWSIEEAARLLDAAGCRDYAINAGGDVIVAGEPEPGRPWRVGIRHPRIVDRVAAVLLLRDRAVATSGRYERGDHIADPRTGAAPRDLLSVTVVGPSLTYADAYATAAFVMGRDGVAWVAQHPGYGAFATTATGRAVWTPDLDGLLARS
jgi:thiamine biosynthesis lipoprotein